VTDILVSGGYGGIRELLGVDELELPDAVIELVPYLPSAESDVKRAIGDWQERMADDSDAALLQSAVMYGTAARLVTREQNRLRAGGWAGSWSDGQISWQDVRSELQAGFVAAIRALLEVADPASAPSGMFTVAGISRRADCQRSTP